MTNHTSVEEGEEEVVKDAMIEGLHDNGDGGDSVTGNYTLSEIAKKINKYLERYRRVAYVPRYPKGHTFYYTKEVSEEDIAS
jgi:hypothetical protein